MASHQVFWMTTLYYWYWSYCLPSRHVTLASSLIWFNPRVFLSVVMVELTRLSPANGQPEASPAAALSHGSARSGQGDKSESREDPEPLQHRDLPQWCVLELWLWQQVWNLLRSQRVQRSRCGGCQWTVYKNLRWVKILWFIYPGGVSSGSCASGFGVCCIFTGRKHYFWAIIKY